MADFYEYLWALVGYGKWLITGGPYLVDNIVRRVWPTGSQWLDKRLSPTTRTRCELWIVFSAIFLAGFLAWRDEHSARFNSAVQNSGINAGRYQWELLSPNETVALRAELRGIASQPVAVFCNGDDCGNLARNFRDLFEDLGWLDVYCCSWAFGTLPRGITLWGANDELRGIAGRIERATKGHLKVNVTETFLFDTAKYPLQLYIGPKPSS
jgi:hypothetical protein